jgi:flagellar biosynthesis protein FlhF
MHVRRVYRPTVREALAEAREMLGPGALVLSTELVAAPGWRGWMGRRVVCLTAAASRADLEPPAPPASEDRTPVSAVRQPEAISAARAGVMARLAAVGLDAQLCTAVAATLSESECRHATEETLRRAVCAALEGLAPAATDFARYEVFVGPPGAGKTTTIAKIAARERASQGRTMALVAADGFRAGAIEQLRSYAAIVQSPFRVARTSAELDQALAAARHTALVDTAGRSPADNGLDGLAEVLARRRGVRTHLVLAADTSAASARRIVDRYAPLSPTHAVVTKLDEADSVMPVLGVLRDRGLTVSFLGTGQRVPDDLASATPSTLSAALLGDMTAEGATCH